MEIRLGNEYDTKGIREIWEYCFNDSKEYVDFYFKNKFSPINTLVLEKNGKILSSIHLNQHKLLLNNNEYDVSYVVGVSTLPEVRGGGYMRDLMIKSLEEMKHRNQSISILMPIDFRLYSKYGFENCYDILVQNIDLFNLRKFKLNGEFKKATEDDLKDLVKIYNNHINRLNGSAIRDQKYFKELIEEMNTDGGYVYINYEDDIPVGYLVYSIINDIISVRECYYSSIKAYGSLLKFIFNHNTQIKKVEIYTNVKDPLKSMLDNPKDSDFILKPFLMSRIIDFEKFINDSSYNLSFEEEISTIIRIYDDYLENNNGVFRLFSEGSRLKVIKLDEHFDDKIQCLNISELTSLFTGYKSLEEISFVNGIEYSDEFKRLIPIEVLSSKTNFINEYV